MELGIIIVLALAGIYTTMLVVGAIMEGKKEGRKEGSFLQGGKTAA